MSARESWQESVRELNDARRMLRTAQTTERLTTRQFADGRADFETLREAIRHVAVSEVYVTNFEAIELNMRRIAGEGHKS